MLVAVVTLASSTGQDDALCLPQVVDATTELVSSRGSMAAEVMLSQRLVAARYLPDPAYESLWFRLQDIQYFAVADGFPRIRRRDVPAGVQDGSYDILLSAIADSRTVLGDLGHGPQ